MGRIREISNVTRLVEAVAPITTIYWNPEDNSGEIAFTVKDMVTENGAYLGLQDNVDVKTIEEAISTVRISIPDLLQRVITITLPDASTMDIPAGLLMLTVKKLFDEVYSERYDVLHPPVEEMEEPVEAAPVASKRRKSK